MPVHDHLVAALERAVPDGVRTRATDRLAHAHDASPYLLTPQVVVVPRSTEHVASLLQVSAAQGVPLTFRSGGTSLSGQAGTDGVLVETRSNFRSIEVLDHGLRVRVQPGATVRAVNARLAPFGRKLGPDPASEVACTIGGVVANNSSGMACGTQDNSYHTLESAVLVLPSGTVLDTGEPGAADKLRHLEMGGARLIAFHVDAGADSDELIGRLLKRAELEGRADDTEEVIRRRQEIYLAETEPLIGVYGDRGLLVEVDGMGEVDEVSNRILAALASVHES